MKMKSAWLALLLALPMLPTLTSTIAPAALADDEDGGNGEGVTSPGDAFISPRIRRSAPAAPRFSEAPGEIVVRRLEPMARQTLIAQGYTIKAEAGPVLLLTLPDDLDVTGAIAAVVALDPGAVAAPNAFYRNQQADDGCEAAICGMWRTVGIVDACPGTPFIGVVDTGVNLEHEVLGKADIVVERFGAVPEAPSDSKHGTAVAALLVGARDSRTPGLIPDARLFVADPFSATAGDLRADTFGLVSAIDTLVAAEVDVINLSLAGPDNSVLRATVAEAVVTTPLVAAVGNAGPNASPLFPAGYDEVVAVTAVDRRDRVYRRAVRGSHVDFSAPGVEVPTAASVRGMRPQTGTSFAVPFVTAALAAARHADPQKPLTEVLATLRDEATDLGASGWDDVFGWGRITLDC